MTLAPPPSDPRPGHAAVDTAAAPVLQPAEPRPPAARPTKAGRVDHRAQFSLLIVRGDGVRVLRLNFRRRLPVVLATLAVVAVVAVGALAGDWWHVRRRMRDSASLVRMVAEQQAVIDEFNRRVAELSREISGWRELHARIWEPFGPERAPQTRRSGIGGRTTPGDPPAGSLSEELNRLAEVVMQEGESLRALDRLVSRARKALVALPSRWPVRGQVNSEFGNRLSPWTKTTEFHGGIDIAADQGTPVRAPAAGTVVYAGPHGEYGQAVILDHGQDIRTIYGHLSRIHVRPGQHVERGAEIALTGNTGRSSGPHLHYEILVRGQSVNPRGYLWD